MKVKFIVTMTFIVAMIYVPIAATGQLEWPGGSKDDLKGRALMVLEQKCNVCHAKSNPRKVFTTATMELHAEKIYKQVFVKRRMPKGDAIRLSAQEEATLLQWLETMGVVKL